jgi:hypothetical protein
MSRSRRAHISREQPPLRRRDRRLVVARVVANLGGYGQRLGDLRSIGRDWWDAGANSAAVVEILDWYGYTPADLRRWHCEHRVPIGPRGNTIWLGLQRPVDVAAVAAAGALVTYPHLDELGDLHAVEGDCDGDYGVYTHGRHRITVDAVHSPGVFKLTDTLAHEIGHAVDACHLDGDDRRRFFSEAAGIDIPCCWYCTKSAWSRRPSELYAELFAVRWADHERCVTIRNAHYRYRTIDRDDLLDASYAELLEPTRRPVAVTPIRSRRRWWRRRDPVATAADTAAAPAQRPVNR